MPRGRARAVYRFPEETSRPTTHIQDEGDGDARHHVTRTLCVGRSFPVFQKHDRLSSSPSRRGKSGKGLSCGLEWVHYVRVEVLRKFTRE